jgi:type IV pilus assembly protein PilA
MEGIAMARDERGFTLVELLVVMLILGLLAAIALPAFFNQQAKARDTEAKADVNHVVKLVESCRVDNDSYSDCDEQAELKGGGGVPWGTSPGQAGVTGAGQGFVAYAISKAETAGRNHIFIWQRDANGVTTRFCLDSAFQPLNSGGCVNAAW